MRSNPFEKSARKSRAAQFPVSTASYIACKRYTKALLKLCTKPRFHTEVIMSPKYPSLFEFITGTLETGEKFQSN